MTWHTSVTTLSALGAWDAVAREPDGRATDLSGNARHATAGGVATVLGVSAGAVHSALPTPVGPNSAGGFTHDRITLPTAGVLLARIANASYPIMLFSDYGRPNNPHGCLLDKSDTIPPGEPFGLMRNMGYDNAVGLPAPMPAGVTFGVVYSATEWQFFYQGAWLGAKVTGSFSSLLPTTTGSSWTSPWGTNSSVGGMGIFAGSATLADIVVLSDALSAKLYMGEASSRALVHSLGTLGLLPPEPQIPNGLKNIGFSSALGTGLDMHFGGAGQVTGTVKNTPASPVQRRVVLIDEGSQNVIRQVWSDPVTGAYAFTRIAMGRSYTVLSYDHTQTFRAVVADRVVPEPMVEPVP